MKTPYAKLSTPIARSLNHPYILPSKGVSVLAQRSVDGDSKQPMLGLALALAAKSPGFCC